MATSLKENILSLRNEGKTYNEIIKVLGCTKSTISFHCNNNNLGGNLISEQRVKLTELEIYELNEFYKNNTIEDCMVKFSIGKSTVTKHTNNKYVKLSDEELKIRNYQKVKNFRQKLKEKAIEYKGGCCGKCGYDRCDSALEFHHLDPKEKDFAIGSYSVLSWEKVKVELDKCIMVCANCHREIHHKINNK